MQETRYHIISILREREKATVDDLVTELAVRRGMITSVTVRHHLLRLQEEGFVCNIPQHHKKTPGRPKHLYVLTVQAEGLFPNNYKRLSQALLNQLHQSLPAAGVNVILEGVAETMAQGANIQGTTIEERLESVKIYLNMQGYEASWEQMTDGYVLRTFNCPYHTVAQHDQSLCGMDMHLISRLLGVVPRLMSRISHGDESCSYFIPVG